MVLVNKIKKVARKVNAVALAGAMVVSGMTLMSFVGKKEEVSVKAKPIVKAGISLTDVTYGVVSSSGNRRYITANPVSPGTGGCQLSSGDCKVKFPADDAGTIIQWDGPNPYVEIDDVMPSGTGPHPAN